MTADEPMSTPDSGGLREAVEALLDEHLPGDYTHMFFADPGSIDPPVGCRCGWRRERGVSQHLHLAGIVAELLAAHPEPVPTPVGETIKRKAALEISRALWAEADQFRPGSKSHEVTRAAARMVRRFALPAPDSADDATVGEQEDPAERPCLICGRPEYEHRDRNGHGFVPTRSATPPDDAHRAPVSGRLDEGEREAAASDYTPPMDRIRDEYVEMRRQHYGFADLYAAEFDRALAARDAAWVERLAAVEGERDRRELILADRLATVLAERDTARREAGERIAQAMTDEFADRVEWEDGKQYIAVADAQRIARNEPNL